MSIQFFGTLNSQTNNLKKCGSNPNCHAGKNARQKLLGCARFAELTKTWSSGATEF